MEFAFVNTKDSVVIAGYKIICSTSASLKPPTSCYDGLASARAFNVLLTLPDVTKIFYVAMQIVRNFNGHEILDDKISKVSEPICTGKSASTMC